MTRGRTKTAGALLALAVVLATPQAWSAGRIYYIGSSGNDVRGGTTESDVMKGRGGADTLSGAGGSDRVDGGPGNDAKVSGDGGADLLFGGQGNDVLHGGTGDDILHGGPGADELHGEGDSDTASYAYSEGAVTVTVNGASTANTGGDAAGDTLSGIENLTGSDFGDILTGDLNANVLDGGPGDDVLKPQAGADRIVGGPGADRVDYTGSPSVTVDLAQGNGEGGHAEGDSYAGVEHVTGTAGNDRLIGDDEANTLTGGGGADTLEGLGGADTLQGGTGTDVANYEYSPEAVEIDLSGQRFTPSTVGGHAAGDTLSSIEALIGSPFGDTLIGNTDANVLSGGEGDDDLEGREGADKIQGGNGTDTAAYTSSNVGVTVDLTAAVQRGGHAAGDVLTDIENLAGSGHADRLTGNARANVLEGLAGPDVLDGGGDWDTASYKGSDAGVTVNLNTTGAQTSAGHASGDVLSNIENLTGSDYDDNLKGNIQHNILTGGDGADTLNGKGGGDTASYAGSDAGVTVDLGRTTPQVGAGHATGDLLQSIEALVGSAHDDRLTGNGDKNYIQGGAGSDVINGGGGYDTASYIDSPVGVTIDLTKTGQQTSHGHGSGDTLISIEGLIGSDHADRLTGTAQGSHLDGGPGDDTLHGGAGWDYFIPGPGADTVHGGGGIDELDLTGSSGPVILRLDLTANNGSGGDAEGDTYIGIESVHGSKFNDVIIASRVDHGGWPAYIDGREGDDVIWAGPSSELVSGGPGADILHGGPGRSNRLSYTWSQTGVRVNLVDNTASGGDAEGDVISGFEQILGSHYDDHLTLSGSGKIEGMGGADTLVQVREEGGERVILSYNRSNAGVTVDLSSTGPQSGGHAQGDRLVGGFTSVQGSGHADTLSGTTHADIIAGTGGDDTLNGRGGDDILNGGPGADTLNCGMGFDAVSYDWSDTGVTVDLGANTFSGGEAQGDTATGCEAIHGSWHDDTLAGLNNGGSSLYGGSGNDVIKSEAGSDRLYGGLDNDRFVFGTGAGTDTVVDFRDGMDLLDISALGVSNYAAIQSSITEGMWQGRTSTKIDLTAHGGGTVALYGVRRSSIGASDFVFSE